MATLLGGLLLPLTQAVAQPQLTDITVFTSDPSGNFGGYNIWDTRPITSAPDTYNVFIQSGSSGGPFLTGPDSAHSRPNIGLPLGSSSFRLFGDMGNPPTPYFGIYLFINSSTSPSISVYGPVLTSQTQPHVFLPDSSSMTIAPGPFDSGPPTYVNGSGTITFVSGGERVTLTDYYWAEPSVYNQDQVGPYSVGPNGVQDFVGGLSFSVVAVPEPGFSLWALSFVFGGLGVWRKAKSRTGK